MMRMEQCQEVLAVGLKQACEVPGGDERVGGTEEGAVEQVRALLSSPGLLANIGGGSLRTGRRVGRGQGGLCTQTRNADPQVLAVFSLGCGRVTVG